MRRMSGEGVDLSEYEGLADALGPTGRPRDNVSYIYIKVKKHRF
jgi:hypothetical protein